MCSAVLILRYFKSRIATASIPSLLNPYLLIKASSSGSRKTRGFGFPGCGNGVTVPISTLPNPRAKHPEIAAAFLSNPAASPTGLAK